MSYQTLLEHSNKMLASVRQGDWNSLIEYELDYICEVERLQSMEHEAPLDAAEQEQKRSLLEVIIDQDHEIKNHLLNYRKSLEKTILSMHNKQTLESSYRN
ncbi:Flagellar protein FliT [Pseudidiomarina piscicola]|uniref:Flagellar protein FliT n=1 Tax=Pseudidiomarina piscicola TaxID=2614830 RepID=A0A6S6WUV4_9GAMM|nr:flagellar protein FliT [Pseudidiomarina piscicola]CAB0151062.1 Flagellar protein FliT [Pseudidiomarina piscicola]VZT40572.1 Flagellar protein FliT [Pseudomonas aeruginosa]